MLTVLCADLSLTPDDIGAWPPTLARRLARARVHGQSRDDSPIPLHTPAEAWLKRQFSVPENPSLTISAYLRHVHGATLTDLPAPDRVLTVTPAYLHATLDHLVLSPASELTVTRRQADELAFAANAFLMEDNIELRVITPDCWLLITPTSLKLELRGSLQASGRNIHAYMPGGEDGRRLRVLLNELQMLWHDHPVNQSRIENGQVPINSLWVEGVVHSADQASPAPFDQVVSKSPVTRGLATGFGVATISEDTSDDTKLATASATQNILLELSGPNAIAELDSILSATPKSVALTLCDQRNRLELLSAGNDRFRFWRRQALRVPPDPNR